MCIFFDVLYTGREYFAHAVKIMSSSFDVLWISTCQSLKRFDLPLLYYLAHYIDISVWEYQQTLDEPSYIEAPVELLYSYLKSRQNPVHLIGHGINGAVALLFARQYPHRVRSLTLLGVSSQPGNTWDAYYYKRRQILDASSEEVLVHVIRSMFGEQLPYPVGQLINFFSTSLETTPSTHSIINTMKLTNGGAKVPLMVCGTRNDAIVTEPELREWLTWYQQGDGFWQYNQGNHFFHYFYPQETGKEILSFWEHHHPDMFFS